MVHRAGEYEFDLDSNSARHFISRTLKRPQYVIYESLFIVYFIVYMLWLYVSAARHYWNDETPVVMKYFDENFVDGDWSVWTVEYKYQNELKKITNTNNLIKGWELILSFVFLMLFFSPSDLVIKICSFHWQMKICFWPYLAK